MILFHSNGLVFITRQLKITSSEGILESSILTIWSFTVALTLKTEPIFLKDILAHDNASQ